METADTKSTTQEQQEQQESRIIVSPQRLALFYDFKDPLTKVEFRSPQGKTFRLSSARSVSARNLAKLTARVRTDKLSEIDIVVIPSLSFDPSTIKHVEAINFYEERSLWFLYLLNHLKKRIVFTSSHTICQRIVDYMLSLLPNTTAEEAKTRLLMMPCHDNSYEPLTLKLLRRPRARARILNFVRKDRAVLHVFVSTGVEKMLADRMEIPSMGCDPEFGYFGTKRGSRQVFHAAGVRHVYGNYRDLWTVDEIASEILALWKGKPTLTGVVIKINEGLSGFGNGILELPKGLDKGKDAFSRLKTLIQTTTELAKGITREWFFESVKRRGCIIEEYVRHPGTISPSCQAIIDPDGKVRVVSTHEQVLDGQVYKGCICPASQNYRFALQEETLKAGRYLAEKGARDRLAVDYLAWPEKDEEGVEKWHIAAIEINLRHGGTTSPAATCKLLCNAEFDTKTGFYVSTDSGLPKCYVSSDNLQSNAYKGLTPADFLDIVNTCPALQWNKKTQTGVVFHMISALSEHGKLGLTAIGNDPDSASKMFDVAKDALDRLTAHDHDEDVPDVSSVSPRAMPLSVQPQQSIGELSL
jgi:hypothetical protein